MWSVRMPFSPNYPQLTCTLDFEYSIPDIQTNQVNTYTGTSRKDPNFPVRLSLSCPPCRAQAEQLTKFFSKKGREFHLYYHPSSFNLPFLFRRKRKSTDSAEQDKAEGLFPLYTLDPGFIAEKSYQSFTFGTGLLIAGLSATRKNWR